MRSARTFLCALAVVALVASACGDDDDDDAGSTDTAAAGDTTAGDTTAGDTATTAAGGDEGAGGAARGITDTTVRVGGLGQLDIFPGLEEGLRARFERANSEGGVNGRTIDFVGFEDDGSDAAANLDLARDFVENQEVFAVVTATSAVMLPATTDYFNEQHVPFVGWGFQPGYCVLDGYGYGFNGCLSGLAFGVPEPVNNSALIEPIAELLGDPEYTAAVLNSDDDAGRGGSAQYNQLYGDRLLYEDFVPTSGVTDYSPYVNGVLESGADAAMVACDFACTLAVKAALTGAGFEGPIFDFSTYIPGLLADPAIAGALEGTYTNVQFPPQESATPAIEQILADLEAIDAEPFMTVGVAVGYWSADVFLQMLAAAGDDVTPESFHDTINAGFTYEPAEGGLGPISFPEGFQQPSPCSALVKVEEGEYLVEVPFDCYGVVPAT